MHSVQAADIRTRLIAAADLPRRYGIFLDFDGTLSDIVLDPSTAMAVEGASKALGELSRRFGVVAVVSGRPVEFLRSRLDVPPAVRLVGLYGLQVWRDGAVAEDRGAAKWRTVVDAGAATAEMELPREVRVERKGLSFVLHYRTSPAYAPLVEEWAARYAEASGLDASSARLAVELGPFRSMDKGAVVRKLRTGLRGGVVFGDDIGDLPAFDALAVPDGEAFDSTCVAVGSSELPAALQERADAVVSGPTEVVEVLRWLADQVA
jgi:trehalose 6-phosphate phosphatase